MKPTEDDQEPKPLKGTPTSGGGPVSRDEPHSPFGGTSVEHGEPPPPSDRNADGDSNPNINKPPEDGSDRMTQ